METSQKVFCTRPKVMNIKEEMFYNFKLSVRGAIRQAPSVITWCEVLLNMKGNGYTDSVSLIKEWNDGASTSSKLGGGKVFAVRKVLTSMPSSALNLVCSHMSEMGWLECAFTDDAFSNKCLYPGHVYKHGRPGWKDLCKVSERSMEVHFSAVINAHRSQAPWARRKVSKKDLEEGSELATVVVALAEEAVNGHGLKKEDVDKCFVDEYVLQKDSQIALEVYGILAEKPEHLPVDNMTALKALKNQKAMRILPA